MGKGNESDRGESYQSAMSDGMWLGPEPAGPGSGSWENGDKEQCGVSLEPGQQSGCLAARTIAVLIGKFLVGEKGEEGSESSRTAGSEGALHSFFLH